MMKKSKIFVIVAVLLIITSVLLVTTRSLAVVNGTSNMVSGLDRLISKPFNFLVSLKSDLADLSQTYNENKELKKALFELKENAAELEEVKNENEQLRQLLEMKEINPSSVNITADVINRVPVSWMNELLVNIGKEDGVQPTMLAVASGGLIGSVKDISSHSSRINLVTNHQNMDQISVRIQSTSGNIYGVLAGYSTEKSAFIISQLNRSEEIKEGEPVLTSGLGTYNIANIPVGTVLSVTEKEDHLTREVLVKPSADLSDIRVVTLVGK